MRFMIAFMLAVWPALASAQDIRTVVPPMRGTSDPPPVKTIGGEDKPAKVETVARAEVDTPKRTDSDVVLPAEINCKPGRIVKIKATVTAGLEVFWDTGGLIPGQDFDFIKLDGTSAMMLFPADLVPQGGAKFRIGALVATDKNKISSSYTTVIVGTPGPVPPGPGPGPGPGPTPGPVPIPGDGLRCLIVYESGDLGKIPPQQEVILYSDKIRGYLNSKCALGSDGKTKEWRIWDKDVDASNEAKLWQDVLKRDRKSTPWIVISNGKTGFEGPLPANIDDTLKLLQQYGG